MNGEWALIKLYKEAGSLAAEASPASLVFKRQCAAVA